MLADERDGALRPRPFDHEGRRLIRLKQGLSFTGMVQGFIAPLLPPSSGRFRHESSASRKVWRRARTFRPVRLPGGTPRAIAYGKARCLPAPRPCEPGPVRTWACAKLGRDQLNLGGPASSCERSPRFEPWRGHVRARRLGEHEGTRKIQGFRPKAIALGEPPLRSGRNGFRLSIANGAGASAQAMRVQTSEEESKDADIR